MKVAELLKRRREHWQELERLCDLVASKRKKSLLPEQISRFATLYRAACADLALADSYQLPPNTVQYLHRLVGRAHNQLYRSQQFNIRTWAEILLMEVPQKIFRDRCVQLMFCLFWGGFLLSAWLAYSTAFWPQYATNMLTDQGIESMTEMFKNPISRGPGQSSANFAAAGFYIQHNTTIGLKCFGGGLGVIPGIFITLYNAAHLGAAFGYMARPDVAQGENFFHFVTAHGPFELTAIVLSAGAGLRLGMSWISTQRLTRIESLKKTAREAMPIMGAAMIMFFLAALIEGFISPSPLPYIVKATISVCSSSMLMFYFVVLGFPRTR